VHTAWNLHIRCGSRHCGGSLIVVFDGNLAQRGQHGLVLFLFIFGATENRSPVIGMAYGDVWRHPWLRYRQPTAYGEAVKPDGTIAALQSVHGNGRSRETRPAIMSDHAAISAD
jgi:hypothetical protein